MKILEDIKKTLAHWKDNSEGFDLKLVAREETGCCDAQSSSGMAGEGETPCAE